MPAIVTIVWLCSQSSCRDPFPVYPKTYQTSMRAHTPATMLRINESRRRLELIIDSSELMPGTCAV